VSAAHHKTYALRQKALATATDAQMAAINGYTLREFAADEVMVREYVLAHNCIDRDKECFDEPLLADFARTLPGKGVFVRHPGGWDGDSGPGEGRVFDAMIEETTLEAARTLLRQPDLTLPPDRQRVTLLKSLAYYARTPENEALLIKHDAGIVSDVSIGFTAGERNRIKGPDGIELNAWRWVGPGEALEQSLVWLGAQPGARAIKSATTTRNTEESDMDLQQTQQKLATTEQSLAAVQPKAAAHDSLKAALKGIGAEELSDQPEQLAALVEAGKGYRDSLVDTIVKAERAEGVLGDSEDEVKAAKKDYAAMPLRALKTLATRAAKALEGTAKAGVTGSDPNAQKPEDKGTGKGDEMPEGFASKAFG
jgi:hypothetical protein